MMMSSSLPDVQTDADGLIIPKKLINPCLESSDHKQLRRELKFNTKMGINVLNQKNELQKAYEKQRAKQQLHQQQLQSQQQIADQSLSDQKASADSTATALDLQSELNRVMQERAQKQLEQAQQQQQSSDNLDEDDRPYVNPEYLKVRAKLKAGSRIESNNK